MECDYCVARFERATCAALRGPFALREPNKKNTAKSFIWVLANQSYSDHPMRVFRYVPSRAGKACHSRYSRSRQKNKGF